MRNWRWDAHDHTKHLTHANYIQFIKMCLISNDMGVTSGMFSHDVFTVSSKLAVFLFYPAEKLPVTN